jgi:hypothetical protein
MLAIPLSCEDQLLGSLVLYTFREWEAKEMGVHDKVLDSRLGGSDGQAEILGTKMFLLRLLFP